MWAPRLRAAVSLLPSLADVGQIMHAAAARGDACQTVTELMAHLENHCSEGGLVTCYGEEKEGGPQVEMGRYPGAKRFRFACI